MANQVINVIVNSKGAVTVKRELDAMGDSARQTTTYLNGLRAILASALTFSGASAIVATIDNFTQLQNRLKLVSDGTQELATNWKALLQVANQSYQSIDSTVTLYFRVAQAFKSWGENAQEAMKFTELFQKAAALSGSTVQSTAQAVYQFGQALNKGKLDGDEFKSVLENLPYVASLIEKSLGVTRKELYKMSEEGKISVDRLKQAFMDAAATIEGDFSKITPTIGMALTVLNNNWVDFIGSIQNSTGVFSLVAQLILLIANNFTFLAIAMAPVAVSFAFLAGRLGIGLVVIGLRDLSNALKLATAAQWLYNMAVAANPYVLAAVAIAAVVALLVYFRNEIGLTNEFFTMLWTTAVSTFTAIMSYITPVVNAFVAGFNWLTKWVAIFAVIKAMANTTREDLVNMFKTVINAVARLVTYIGQSLYPLFQQIVEIFVSFGELVSEVAALFMDVFGPAIDETWSIFKKLWEYVRPALTKFGVMLSDILAGWKLIASYLTNNFLPAVKAVFEGWIWILKQVLSFVQDIISALKLAVKLMGNMGGGAGAAPKAKGAHYGAQFNAGEGFATGGAFKVGGTGSGRDTTPVAFRAERGERVTVETRKQQRTNDNQQTAANVNVPVSIVNVFDPSIMPAANMSQQGQRSIVNAITANRDEINSILGNY